MQTPTALCYLPISRPILLHRRSAKCVAEAYKYAHYIGLYLGFPLSWVLGPFVRGRLQNLKTSEDTFGHDITSLTAELRTQQWHVFASFIILSTTILQACLFSA